MVWLRGCQDDSSGAEVMPMVESDPRAIQGDLTPATAAELAAAGFSDVQEIGHGGFGAVYRCWQRALERTVAIKVLTTDLDADNVERFLREQRAMGKLCGHPNIVKIFQVGVTRSGRPYIVMQYHPRNSLGARIHPRGPARLAGNTSHWRQDGGRAGDSTSAGHSASRRETRRTYCSATMASLELTDFGIARVTGGFQTLYGRGHGLARVYRARGAPGPDPHAGLRRLQSRRHAVLRIDRPCRRRTTQRRAGGWPNSSGSPALLFQGRVRSTSPTTSAPRSDMQWRKIPTIGRRLQLGSVKNCEKRRVATA